MGLNVFTVTYKRINVSSELARGILDNLNNIEDCGTHYYIPDPDDREGVADCLNTLPEHLHEEFKALVKEHGGDTICIG